MSDYFVGAACDDVNECDNSVLNDCDAQQGVCTNQDKSVTYPLGYTCSCQTGYELSADGFSCNDLNECKSVPQHITVVLSNYRVRTNKHAR